MTATKVVVFRQTEGEPVTVTVKTRTPAQTTGNRPTTLVAALQEVEAKRGADLIRFRTCCADPRASK